MCDVLEVQRVLTTEVDGWPMALAVLFNANRMCYVIDLRSANSTDYVIQVRGALRNCVI